MITSLLVPALNGMSYVRIIPNQKGATVIWAFVRPDSLSDEQFENQLKMFDGEIKLWEEALEAKNRRT